MICDDWGDVSGASIAQEFLSEHSRWTEGLHWDLDDSLTLIERARTARQLPGLVVRNRTGRIVGWTFYLLRNEILEVGALVGRSASAIRHLLDGILACPEAELAKGLSCFVFPTSSSVRSALERRHFAVTRFPYLARSLSEDLGPEQEATTEDVDSVRLRPWREADAIGTVRLLGVAYAGSTAERCFAPHQDLGEWAQYVGQLLGSPGCGRFMPEWSVVAEERSTQAVVGVTMATRVAPDTAHIAQVAVDPGFEGQGLGGRLVRTSAQRARHDGLQRLTLLVSEDNPAANALYRRLGFQRTTEFLFASRARPARRAFLPLDRSGEVHGVVQADVPV